jgi:hypothetical protein
MQQFYGRIFGWQFLIHSNGSRSHFVREECIVGGASYKLGSSQLKQSESGHDIFTHTSLLLLLKWREMQVLCVESQSQ